MLNHTITLNAISYSRKQYHTSFKIEPRLGSVVEIYSCQRCTNCVYLQEKEQSHFCRQLLRLRYGSNYASPSHRADKLQWCAHHRGT